MGSVHLFGVQCTWLSFSFAVYVPLFWWAVFIVLPILLFNSIHNYLFVGSVHAFLFNLQYTHLSFWFDSLCSFLFGGQYTHLSFWWAVYTPIFLVGCVRTFLFDGQCTGPIHVYIHYSVVVGEWFDCDHFHGERVTRVFDESHCVFVCGIHYTLIIDLKQ